MKEKPLERVPDTFNSSPKQEGKFLIGYRTSVDLIKALIWPVVTIFIFLSIRTPLLSLLRELPALLPDTTRLTVAGVSLERRLKEAAVPPEVQRAVGSLSPTALRLLLDTGKVGMRYLDKDWERTNSDASAIHDLTKAGLGVVTESSEGSSYPMQYNLTDSGKYAYEVLLRILVEQLCEAPRASGNQ